MPNNITILQQQSHIKKQYSYQIKNRNKHHSFNLSDTLHIIRYVSNSKIQPPRVNFYIQRFNLAGLSMGFIANK